MSRAVPACFAESWQRIDVGGDERRPTAQPADDQRADRPCSSARGTTATGPIGRSLTGSTCAGRRSSSNGVPVSITSAAALSSRVKSIPAAEPSRPPTIACSRTCASSCGTRITARSASAALAALRSTTSSGAEAVAPASSWVSSAAASAQRCPRCETWWSRAFSIAVPAASMKPSANRSAREEPVGARRRRRKGSPAAGRRARRRGSESGAAARTNQRQPPAKTSAAQIARRCRHGRIRRRRLGPADADGRIGGAQQLTRRFRKPTQRLRASFRRERPPRPAAAPAATSGVQPRSAPTAGAGRPGRPPSIPGKG